MPWRRYYRRRWRRRRSQFWRPRATFRRRLWKRRYWVRNKRPKRKLKKLRLTEWQPKAIRKCNVKGFLCLFQTGIDRISYNFDMYETSIIPEKLPGGGGFSIKNLSLLALYDEHIHGHNIFTHTNQPYQLMRYLGCTMYLYQSLNVDYIMTYSNTWPLKSTMLMYNTMQPSIHALQKNKILIPSKNTWKWKKPYKKVYIPPPTQMQNKWYFQHDLATTPLFMIRTSSTSFDHWYIGTRMQSTNITITSLNYLIIQNRDWDSLKEYNCRQLGTIPTYLYTTKAHYDNPENIKLKNLIFLSNTKDHITGMDWEEYEKKKPSTTAQQQWFEQFKLDKATWGNPFHEEYLIPNEPVFSSTAKWATILNVLGSKLTQQPDITFKAITGHALTPVSLTETLRYNPYKDNGSDNLCYFLPVKRGEHGWDPPADSDLINENLPLWIMLYGFSDFQKKLAKIQKVDTDYILVLKSDMTQPKQRVIVPLSASFIEGWSPYETSFNILDQHRWYPCFQYQQEINNAICLSGPGTPKINKGDTVEAKIRYKFHFKWGGEFPPMELIQNPTEKTTYPIPSKQLTTNSLQNPTQRPETFLYPFDERQGLITQKAAKRIKKDWGSKATTSFSTEPRFGEEIQTQDPQETTSEEEEEAETLYEQLQLQRAKQQRIKRRILETLQQLQKLE
nr:MAG: ORF1 [TTV-like mini virus]